VLIPEGERIRRHDQSEGHDENFPTIEPETHKCASREDVHQSHQMLADRNENQRGNMQQERHQKNERRQKRFLAVDGDLAFGEPLVGSGQKVPRVELDVTIRHLDSQHGAQDQTDEDCG